MKFKSICDKVAAMGQPVEDMEKIQWFLYGLGASYEMISISIHTSKPYPSFWDFLSHAESHELFLHSLHVSSTQPVTFFSQQPHASNTTILEVVKIKNWHVVVVMEALMVA